MSEYAEPVAGNILLETSSPIEGRVLRAKRVGRHVLSPGFAQVIWMEVLFFAVFAFVSVSFYFAGGVIDEPTTMLVTLLITWGVTLVVAKEVGKARVGELFPMGSFSLQILPGLAIASAGILFLFNDVASLIPVPEAMAAAFADQARHALHPALLGASIVLAPIAEELYYRGFVLRGLLSRYSTRTAVIGSAAVFAVAHLNPWQAVLAFPFGLFAAWLYLRTRSLVPCILAHFVLNATHLPFVLLALMSGESLEGMVAGEPVIGPGIVLGSILTSVGAWWVWIMLPLSSKSPVP